MSTRASRAAPSCPGPLHGPALGSSREEECVKSSKSSPLIASLCQHWMLTTIVYCTSDCAQAIHARVSPLTMLSTSPCSALHHVDRSTMFTTSRILAVCSFKRGMSQSPLQNMPAIKRYSSVGFGDGDWVIPVIRTHHKLDGVQLTSALHSPQLDYGCLGTALLTPA